MNDMVDSFIAQLTDDGKFAYELKNLRYSLTKNKQYQIARARLDDIEKDIIVASDKIGKTDENILLLQGVFEDLDSIVNALKLENESISNNLLAVLDNILNLQNKLESRNLALDENIDFMWNSNGATMPDIPLGKKLNIAMRGLKYRGSYTKNVGYNVLSDNVRKTISYTNNIDTGTVVQDNWYGIFAVDNNNAIDYKLVTFARVHSVVGNKVLLAKHLKKLEQQNYGFSVNAYENSDYIVMSGSGLSRMGKIISNDANSITLDNITGLSQGDWIMISPAGFSSYSYLSSIFRDTAETMNFYKIKDWIYGYNSRDLFKQPTTTDWTAIDVFDSGLAPPTARMVRVFLTLTYNGTSPFHFYLASDSGNHILFDSMFPTGTSPYFAVTAECPIEWANGKLYFKSDQPVNNLQVRVMGYLE